jgi:hypothetical protein
MSTRSSPTTWRSCPITRRSIRSRCWRCPTPTCSPMWIRSRATRCSTTRRPGSPRRSRCSSSATAAPATRSAAGSSAPTGSTRRGHVQRPRLRNDVGAQRHPDRRPPLADELQARHGVARRRRHRRLHLRRLLRRDAGRRGRAHRGPLRLQPRQRLDRQRLRLRPASGSTRAGTATGSPWAPRAPSRTTAGASANGMVAWTGYTDGGDFDADIGLVRVNRAVGMLTGWYGWRSANWDSCNTLGLFFNNASFPAEGCGSPGLHNGRDMYYWFGNFDLPGHQPAPHRHHPRLLHGAVGRAERLERLRHRRRQPLRPRRRVELEPHDPGPVRQAVDRGPQYMNDTFKPDARGDVFDLQALQVRVGPTTILAGEARSPRHRPGAQRDQREPGQRDLRVQHVPLDQQQHLDDRHLLADRSYTFDYAAMQNLNLNTGNVTIPKNTPSGTYWVGIVLDDQDAPRQQRPGPLGRDTRSPSTASPTSSPTPAAPPAAPPTTATPSASATTSRTRAATRPTRSPSTSTPRPTPTSRASTPSSARSNIGTFNGSQTKSGSVNLTIPEHRSGNYYIGYIASASDDFYVNQDNEAYDATQPQHRRAGRPVRQLPHRARQRRPASAARPTSASTSRTTAPSRSGAYEVDVYASTNTIISTFDTLLGTSTARASASAARRPTIRP